MSSAAQGWWRWRTATRLGWPARRWVVAGAAGLILLGGAAIVLTNDPDLPDDVRGTMVFISDRSGIDTLYVRVLPSGRDRRLTDLDEPVREPALSPDGKRVAFSVGGRIGVVDVAGGPERILTLGAEYKDASPTWRADGRALAVAARTSETAPSDIHLLSLEPGVELGRRALTETEHLDESQPVFSPDGQALVYVREDSLYGLDVADGRTRRLAGGFRKARSPRFLPNGRVLFLWVEGKEYGIDSVDLEGKGRATLATGTTYYRSVVPSPDGRYLAATFSFDLAFHPLDALKLGQREELRLLDLQGTRLAELAGSWRHANHSADWGR